MNAGEMQALRNSLAGATAEIERDRDEWRAIAEKMRADLRVYDRVSPGYSHLQGAAEAFDRKAGGSDE